MNELRIIRNETVEEDKLRVGRKYLERLEKKKSGNEEVTQWRRRRRSERLDDKLSTIKQQYNEDRGKKIKTIGITKI